MSRLNIVSFCQSAIEIYGIGLAIGFETQWPTSTSIPIPVPIPMLPHRSTASTSHRSERNSDTGDGWANLSLALHPQEALCSLARLTMPVPG